MPNSSWYVVYTKPLKEMLATSMMEERLGLQVYLPEVKRMYRGAMRMAPFFPRYVFTQIDLDQVKASEINTLPGIVRLVEMGGHPQRVEEEVVAGIRRLVDDYNAGGGLPLYRFHPGDRVRLKEGPLAGIEGTVVRQLSGKERVMVLLTFLGRMNEVELDAMLIERASGVMRPKRERRTRGKGRRIRSSRDRDRTRH